MSATYLIASDEIHQGAFVSAISRKNPTTALKSETPKVLSRTKLWGLFL